jgi:predicted acylesterase/phospholipase RssA
MMQSYADGGRKERESMTRAGPRNESVVFASGGCRCFWQAGFWQIAAPMLSLAPRTVAAASGGAAIACMLFAGVMDGCLRSFMRLTSENQHNVYPGNLLGGGRVFPHERIYRTAILENLDVAALRRLHAGPDVRVVLSRPPAWLNPRSAAVVGFIANRTEHLMRSHLHPVLARRAGFLPEVVSVRDCRSPEELADLILQSSCMPPFIAIQQRGNHPVLDGGLVDSVPVDVLDGLGHPMLILLTKAYPADAIPRVVGRTYVQPSQPVPIDAWDYTSARGVQATVDLGRRDAEHFVNIRVTRD